MRPRLIILLLLCLIPMLAACGGNNAATSEKSATKAKKSQSNVNPRQGGQSSAKQAFVARFDRLCLEANRATAPFGRELNALGQSSTPENPRAARLMARIANVANAFVRRMGALTPPRGEERPIAQVIAAGNAQAATLTKLAGALSRVDVQAVTNLQSRLGAANSRWQAVTRGYGFRYCGRT